MCTCGRMRTWARARGCARGSLRVWASAPLHRPPRTGPEAPRWRPRTCRLPTWGIRPALSPARGTGLNLATPVTAKRALLPRELLPCDPEAETDLSLPSHISSSPEIMFSNADVTYKLAVCACAWAWSMGMEKGMDKKWKRFSRSLFLSLSIYPSLFPPITLKPHTTTFSPFLTIIRTG